MTALRQKRLFHNRSLCEQADLQILPFLLQPRIGFGDIKRNRITGKQVTRKLPSKLVEQARSASVLAKRHVVDLMYKSIPTRHSALSTADFDCDQLVGDFSELRSYRNFRRSFSWSTLSITRVSFFELSAFWRVPVSRVHAFLQPQLDFRLASFLSGTMMNLVSPGASLSSPK